MVATFDGHNSSERLVGAGIAITAALGAISYLLRFFPSVLDSPWWARSLLRRSMRWILGWAWVMLLVGFVAGALISQLF